MIGNIAIGIVTTVMFFVSIIFLVTSKHEDMLEPLNDEEFPLKFCYGIGFGICEKLHMKFRGRIGKKMRKDVVVLYGEKYAEYYLRVYYAQRITFSVLLADVFLFLLCVCSSEDRMMMFVMMIVVILVVNYYYITLLAEKIKKNSDKYLIQFPNVASTMALLVNAGMIITEAWEIIAKSGNDDLHKQMKITLDEIENGVSFGNALSRFSNRCATMEIRKFTSSVLQSMEKGNRELADALNVMSKELWYEKKQRVLQLAEVSGNKVLIPIMMMFVGILVMIMAPIVTNMF